MSRKHIFIIAGESSGDQHAANYVKEHRKLDSNIYFSAIGQQELKSENVDIIFELEELDKPDHSGTALSG